MSGATSSSVTDRNRAAVHEAFTSWAQGRGSVFDLLADDAVWTIPGSLPGAGVWHGRRAYVDDAVTPLLERLVAPVRPELIGIWADGEAVIVRWRQETPLKVGGAYRNDYAWFLTMNEGRATAVTAFLDLAAYTAARGTLR